MKHVLLVKSFYFLIVILLFGINQTDAQCVAGYTQSVLKWDYLDFIPNTGRYVSPTAYIDLAKSQTQYFSFGAQGVRVNHNYSGNNDPGDDGTHTGSTGSYGTGDDVHFIGKGTVTFTFDTPVLNTQFSIYDIDR